MSRQDFKSSLKDDTPPQGISTALEALWHQSIDEEALSTDGPVTYKR